MADAATKSRNISAPTVHRGMQVLEIVALFPAAADIMGAYGLHCFSCSLGGVESLEEGCKMHQFDDDMIDALILDLNEAILQEPDRPQKLTITVAAAKAIGTVAKAEKHVGEVLEVIAESDGGFCMEFQKKPHKDHLVFTNEKHPDVQICASPLTLWRIGGATIDFREERFKLDLSDDGGCCGGAKKECGCHG